MGLTDYLEEQAACLLGLGFRRTRLERYNADCIAEDLNARNVQK